MGNESTISSQHAQDFFLFSYFGITPKEWKSVDKDAIMKKCAKRAYLDLNRTLEFRKAGEEKVNQKKDEEARKKFVEAMRRVILKKIKALLSGEDIDFAAWHEDLCGDKGVLVKKATKYKHKDGEPILTAIKLKDGTEIPAFSAGQAQKWVNMTLKYMWILGLWEKELKPYEPDLHVPVDRYIMEAASRESELNIGEIPHEKGGTKKFSPSSKPWSRWNYDEYFDFQKAVRKECEKKKLSPIQWEGPAWIKIAAEKG